MDDVPVKNILIVDDREGIRELMELNLTREKRIIMRAASGEEAIEIVKEHNGHFDFIIMDQRLETDGIDGIQAMQKIKDIYPDIDVILITGKEKIAREALSAGAYRFFYKPINFEDLNITIDSRDDLRILESQLDQEKNFLSSIIENATVGISVIDRSMRIAYLNDRQKRITPGAKKGGICFEEFSGSENVVRVCPNCPFQQTFNDKRKHDTIRIIREWEERLGYFEVSSFPLYDSRGNILAAVEVSNEVTERETLFDLGKKFQGTMDLDTRLDIILETILSWGWNRARLYLLSNDKKYLIGRQKSADALQEFESIRIPLDRYPYGFKTINSKEIQIYTPGELGYDPWAEIAGKTDIKNWGEIPIVLRENGKEEVLGIIGVDNAPLKSLKEGEENIEGAKEPKVDRGDLIRLRTFAEFTATIIADSRKYKRRVLSRRLVELDSRVAKCLEIDDVIRTIITGTIDLLKEEIEGTEVNGYVMLRDGNKLIKKAGTGVYEKAILELNILDDVLSPSVIANNSKKEFLTGDADNNTEWKKFLDFIGKNWEDSELKSYLHKVKSVGSFPVMIGDEVIGILNIRSEKEDLFSEDVLFLIRGAVARSIQALDNARKYAHLTELNQMKDNFFIEMAHELKSPLTTSAMYLDRFFDKGGDKYRNNKYLRTISSEINSYSHLTDNLLNFARIAGGRIEPAFNEQNLQRIIHDLKTLYESGNREVIIDFPDNIPQIKTDGEMVKAIFKNIIDNALKFSPEDKPVQIKAQVETNVLHITVSDEGYGIDPEEHTKIFEPRYQGKHKKDGLGLGLHIVKHYCNLLNWEINIDSKLGKGTKVSLSIPIHTS